MIQTPIKLKLLTLKSIIYKSRFDVIGGADDGLYLEAQLEVAKDLDKVFTECPRLHVVVVVVYDIFTRSSFRRVRSESEKRSHNADWAVKKDGIREIVEHGQWKEISIG